jgi:hypothetical protein
MIFHYPSVPSAANIFNSGVTTILDPFVTTKNKTVMSLSGVHTGGTSLGVDNNIKLSSGLFMSTNAITSIQLKADASSFVQFSRFSLYGVTA